MFLKDFFVAISIAISKIVCEVLLNNSKNSLKQILNN